MVSMYIDIESILMMKYSNDVTVYVGCLSLTTEIVTHTYKQIGTWHPLEKHSSFDDNIRLITSLRVR